jgi:hypothetical protein
LQPETRRYSGGKVNANGEFEVLKLPIGNYLMSVSQNPPKTLKDEPFDKRIPAKYRDEDTSGFAIEIKEGDNQIDLKMGE